MRTFRRAEKTARSLESSTALDPAAEKVASLAEPLLGRQPLRSWLSGSFMGHPLHPAMILLPLGGWAGSAVLDVAGQDDAARTLVGFGVVAALPAATTGLSDWMDTTQAERRVGIAHMAANSTALAMYTGSWLLRRSGRHGAGKVLGLAGALAAGAGGWLGGHLSYSLGVGVDTNAFSAGPLEEWTPLGVEVPPDGRLVRSTAGASPVMATRQGGAVRVLADRCSHRGGPLSEGEVSGGCVTCPWHGSRFELATGLVATGPAVAPQPVYEVREDGSEVLVRRDEVRGLRTNTVQPAPGPR